MGTETTNQLFPSGLYFTVILAMWATLMIMKTEFQDSHYELSSMDGVKVKCFKLLYENVS